MRKIDWEKVGLAWLAAGGFGLALYWWHRYRVATSEGLAWMLQAIEKMEEQRVTIESLQKGAGV